VREVARCGPVEMAVRPKSQRDRANADEIACAIIMIMTSCLQISRCLARTQIQPVRELSF
jgi:hypothetical protein